jgi:hypothetical protein
MTKVTTWEGAGNLMMMKTREGVGVGVDNAALAAEAWSRVG